MPPKNWFFYLRCKKFNQKFLMEREIWKISIFDFRKMAVFFSVFLSGQRLSFYDQFSFFHFFLPWWWLLTIILLIFGFEWLAWLYCKKKNWGVCVFIFHNFWSFWASKSSFIVTYYFLSFLAHIIFRHKKGENWGHFGALVEGEFNVLCWEITKIYCEIRFPPVYVSFFAVLFFHHFP